MFEQEPGTDNGVGGRHQAEGEGRADSRRPNRHVVGRPGGATEKVDAPARIFTTGQSISVPSADVSATFLLPPNIWSNLSPIVGRSSWIGGAVLWFTAPRQRRASVARIGIAPSGVIVSGTW